MNDRRRKEIKDCALEFLTLCVTKGIKLKLPVPIKAMAKSVPNCRLIPYSVQCKRRKISLKEMISYTGTDDACCDYDAKRNLFIIFYNDVDPAKMESKRYRWNIAHELGHILLNHHLLHEDTRLFRSRLSDTTYLELEEEANAFAAYILVPHGALIVYSTRVSITERWIQKFCSISGPAAKFRYSCYRQWIRNNPFTNGRWADVYDLKIARLFIKPRTCKSCGFVFARGENDRYCPICRGKHFVFGKGEKEMIYSGIETDERGKAKICPRCLNEQTEMDGCFCHICGGFMINRCVGQTGTEDPFDEPIRDACCSETSVLPGNARYCPRCGSETSFYLAKYLKSWSEEQKEQEDDPYDEPF